MKISFDPRYNIAYIYFKNTVAQVTTISVGNGINIDLLEDGSVYGIELMNAREQLDIIKNDGLILENAANGEFVKLVA